MPVYKSGSPVSSYSSLRQQKESGNKKSVWWHRPPCRSLSDESTGWVWILIFAKDFAKRFVLRGKPGTYDH